VASRNLVRQTEAVYLHSAANYVERGVGCPPSRSRVSSPRADADLRETHYSITSIYGDPSTSVFFVSKRGATSGKINLEIHLP